MSSAAMLGVSTPWGAATPTAAAAEQPSHLQNLCRKVSYGLTRVSRVATTNSSSNVLDAMAHGPALPAGHSGSHHQAQGAAHSQAARGASTGGAWLRWQASGAISAAEGLSSANGYGQHSPLLQPLAMPAPSSPDLAGWLAGPPLQSSQWKRAGAVSSGTTGASAETGDPGARSLGSSEAGDDGGHDAFPELHFSSLGLGQMQRPRWAAGAGQLGVTAIPEETTRSMRLLTSSSQVPTGSGVLAHLLGSRGLRLGGGSGEGGRGGMGSIGSGGVVGNSGSDGAGSIGLGGPLEAALVSQEDAVAGSSAGRIRPGRVTWQGAGGADGIDGDPRQYTADQQYNHAGSSTSLLVSDERNAGVSGGPCSGAAVSQSVPSMDATLVTMPQLVEVAAEGAGGAAMEISCQAFPPGGGCGGSSGGGPPSQRPLQSCLRR